MRRLIRQRVWWRWPENYAFRGTSTFQPWFVIAWRAAWFPLLTATLMLHAAVVLAAFGRAAAARTLRDA